jgi:hypothetical protein
MTITNQAAPSAAGSLRKSPQPNPQALAIWVDLMNATDALLLAGLRRKIGPDGDLEEAYRQWYARHMQEHDQMLLQLKQRLHDRDRDPADGE